MRERVEAVMERVAADATLELRRRLLRPHQSRDEVRFPGDDDLRSCHLVARDLAGAAIAVGTVLPEPAPWLPDRPGWRIRGMATVPPARRRGVGSAVLSALLTHISSQGGGIVWCNARLPARALYERAGFTTRGEPWQEPEIGPHVVMWRQVSGARGTAPPWPADPGPCVRGSARATRPPR